MDGKEVQDAVTFLEDARRVYPNVTHLLNTLQLLALDMEPREPFEKSSENEQFVKLAEAYFVTKYSIDQAQGALRVALLEPRKKGKEVDVEEEKLVIKCLGMVRRAIRPLESDAPPPLLTHLPPFIPPSLSPSLILPFSLPPLFQSTGPDTSEDHMGPQAEDH